MVMLLSAVAKIEAAQRRYSAGDTLAFLPVASPPFRPRRGKEKVLFHRH